jgi:hypothetical protein
VQIHKKKLMDGVAKLKKLWEEINVPIHLQKVCNLSMSWKLSNQLLLSHYLVLILILTGTTINTVQIGNAVALLEENNHLLP